LSLHASGQGVITAPEAKAALRISELQFEQRPIPELTIEASVHNRIAEVLLSSGSALTPVKGHGTVEVKAPYRADLHLDTARFSFAPLLASYTPVRAGTIRAETELHASLEGPLQNAKRLEGHLNIEGLTISYHELHLEARKPLRLDYQNG